LPLAPGRFSTTKDWPRRSVSHCAISRATMSVPPPGASPTMMRTGRAGYVCARAVRARTGSAIAPAVRRRNLRRASFMTKSSEPPRPEHLDAELLLHGATETVFHLRSFVIGRRRALVVGLGLDAQSDEVGSRRGDDLGYLAVEIVEI